MGAFAIGLAVCAFVTGSVCAGLPRSGGLAPVWLPNAVLLASFVASRPKVWPLLCAMGCAANIATILVWRVHPAQGAWFCACNTLEYTTAAWALRAWMRSHPNASRSLFLLRLGVVGLCSAAVSGLASSLGLNAISGLAIEPNLTTWFVAHGLGLITITPCLLIMSEALPELGARRYRWRAAASMLVLLATATMVFAQTRYPLLFLIPPALLLVSMELETFGAAAGVLMVEMFELASLYTHTGPMMLIKGNAAEKGAVGQIFLLTALACSVPFAALNVRRRQAVDAATRSELKYRLLAENAEDMIAQCLPDGTITFITPSCQHVLGYSAESMIGTHALDVTHPDDVRDVVAYFRALIARGPGAKAEPFAFRALRADGGYVWLEGQPKVFFDASGAPTSMQDVLRDVSTRKALELELERARAEAEAAVAVKSEFLSNMSHELRTPLTSILGFASMLGAEGGLTEQGRRAVSRVNGSSEALLAIVNDILDFSKLESGQVEIDPRAVDPAAVLTAAMELLEPQAAAKGLTLAFRSEGVMPAHVVMDDSRVRQVLLNLIGNGLKFTSEGGVTVTARYDDETHRLHCALQDTGPGIAPDRLDRLFRRFSQVDASTTRAFGGTGLGLAICRGLVDAMGGEIGVTSVLGRGSCFWFALPCPLADAPLQAIADLDVGTDDDLEGLRVLVTDDNPINRELVRLMLAPLGVQITEAASGEEAVERAMGMAFDLILMDVRMPGMDGPTAARTIRQSEGPNDIAPILAFTADASDGAAMRLDRSVFNDYVAKPIVPGRLIAAARRWAHGGLAPDEAEVRHG